MNETLEIPTSHRTVAPRLPAVRPNLAQRLLRDSAYCLSALPIGVLTFSIVVTGLSAGVGLFVVWVGLPVLVGTVLLARAFAHLERLRLRSLQDREAPAPAYVAAEPGSSALRRLLTPLRDPQSWLDAVWGVVGFVTGTVAFVVTIAWWSAAADGLTYWFWERLIPEGGDTTLAELIGLGEGRDPEIWLNLGIGVLALLMLPLMVRAVAVLHGGTANAILNGRLAGHRGSAKSASPSLVVSGPLPRFVRKVPAGGRVSAGRAARSASDERVETTGPTHPGLRPPTGPSPGVR